VSVQLNKNIITGVSLATLGLIIIILATQVYNPQLENDVGPKVFPYISGGGMLVCGIAIVIRKNRGERKEFLSKPEWKRLFNISLVIVLYGISQRIFGFLISTPIIMYLSMRVMGQPRSKYIQSLGVAIGVTLAVYFLFVRFLHVMLPAGTIF